MKLILRSMMLDFQAQKTAGRITKLVKSGLRMFLTEFLSQKQEMDETIASLSLIGHSSHVNMAFLEWCEEHRIIVAVFPPHSTHRLQPLDVSLFSPLSTFYSQELIKHMATTQGLSRLSKRDFWTLFWPAYQAAFTAKNIGSGWKCTGLLPFDPEVVLSEIRLPASIAPMPADDVDTSLALEKPTARQIRQLTTKVVGKMHQNLDIGARKLVNTIESLQAQVEILQHENKGLRQTIHLEKTRRQRGKPPRRCLALAECLRFALRRPC